MNDQIRKLARTLDGVGSGNSGHFDGYLACGIALAGRQSSYAVVSSAGICSSFVVITTI